MSKIIIANFKMELSLKQSLKLLENYKMIFIVNNIKHTVIACPDYLSLAYLSAKNQEKRTFPFHLGSQNIGHLNYGALTGEVSVFNLKNLGVNFSLIGHSERRKIGEDNFLINEKIKTALKAKITPVVCLGEEKKISKEAFNKYIAKELKELFKDINKVDIKKIIIAYEPVWAIGTNNPCLPKKANEIHQVIKNFIKKNYQTDIKVLYGGSVNEKNAKDYLVFDNIDGLLVGKASTSAIKFKKIIS